MPALSQSRSINQRTSVENKPASLLVVPLEIALNGVLQPENGRLLVNDSSANSLNTVRRSLAKKEEKFPVERYSLPAVVAQCSESLANSAVYCS